MEIAPLVTGRLSNYILRGSRRPTILFLVPALEHLGVGIFQAQSQAFRIADRAMVHPITLSGTQCLAQTHVPPAAWPGNPPGR